ncbi:MAG: hypothetical protein U0838_13020 [Chloroflexota bacterium]
MTAAGGGAAAGAAPDTITITEGGVTVEVRPLGWTDFWTLEADLAAIVAMPDGTPELDAAFIGACTALGRRMDAYAAPGSPALPSRVPPSSMRAFIRRWVREVRDAAVPPPSGGDSPSPPSMV